MIETTLQDCLKGVIDNRGITPHKKGTEWQDTGVPVLSANNIKTTGLQKLDEVRYIPEDIYDSWMKTPLERGDIILTSEAPAGEVYYWDSDDKVVLGQRLYGLKVKNTINSKYLKYYLQSSVGQKAIQSQQSGSTVFGIAAATFPYIPVRLLERNEQDAVATLLYNIDSIITNNAAICSDLYAIARLIFDYWFVQFDFPDENGNPYKSSGGKMVWNEDLKRSIPERWNVVRIGDSITTERGISYSTPNIKTGEGVPMLNLATFMPGGGDYKAEGLKHYLGDYPYNKVLKPFDLIMCNTQQTAIKFETDIIGRAMLVPDIFNSDVVFSHHVNVIRTENEDLKYYLLYLFNSDFFHKYISGFTNGTNILGLSFNGVEDYLCEIPSSDILKRFGTIVLEIEKKKSAIFLENQQLISLRDYLLPMLMNGQVKVNVVED